MKGEYLCVPLTFTFLPCRRTIILADDPLNRQTCAVTLFLAIAMADGALDITNHKNLSNLRAPVWPTWRSLPIHSSLRKMPVLRRVGARSRIISSHAMKGPILYRMMQAQIERWGDEGFSAALQSDIKHAVTREQRRKCFVCTECNC